MGTDSAEHKVACVQVEQDTFCCKSSLLSSLAGQQHVALGAVRQCVALSRC